ncbi:MAG: GNAT family N-acetyltransferase [Ruminococcus sp.]|nr:GNAT family N-acetyltransferase [Ruminococcus sp.]
MKIIPATINDLSAIKKITHDTIKAVYPAYYPKGAVDFFLEHHCDANIRNDISEGIVYLLFDDAETAAGTVTVRHNDIGRLFVLPEYQGRGYGSKLLSFAEKLIAENYEEAVLDSSFPAKGIYLKKGYIFTEYNKIETHNGDFLCFDSMAKKLR